MKIERKCALCGAIKLMPEREAKMRKICIKCHVSNQKRESFLASRHLEVVEAKPKVRRPRRAS